VCVEYLPFQQGSTNVWIDHNEFSSALVEDKDYYDGLLDASHAADFLTFSK
jgi:pectate lyase